MFGEEITEIVVPVVNMEAYSFDFCDFNESNLGTEDYNDLGARPKTGKRTRLPSSTSSDASSMMPPPPPSSYWS